MSAKYPKLSSDILNARDFYNNPNSLAGLLALANLPFNVVTGKVTAGATGVTVKDNVFISPTKLEIKDVNFVIDTVQTGTGNTPKVQLLNLTQSKTIAESADIALSKTIGDVVPLVVDADNAVITEGDVLQLAIVNPAGTITVALVGKGQFAWVSVA